MPTISVVQTLEPYKQLIDKKIQNYIDQLGPKNRVRDACEYALLNDGKRFRPALVMMIAKGLGHEVDVSQAALAIEFFHTASLIADDLPCMDDDSERRNQPTVHRVFGESTALLATYALISSGYACLANNASQIKHHCSLSFAKEADLLCRLAIENISFNTGLFGAASGQLLDLAPPNLTLPMLKEIIHKKTVTLFEISFVLGWLFGGGNQDLLPMVKKSASHFGMAFQFADDIDDMEQDLIHNHSLNIANVCGKENAFLFFEEEIRFFKETLVCLALQESELANLLPFVVPA